MCSENKGADQLRGYREADLRLCFRIGQIPVFSRCGSNRMKCLHELIMLFHLPHALLYLNVIDLYETRL